MWAEIDAAAASKHSKAELDAIKPAEQRVQDKLYRHYDVSDV